MANHKSAIKRARQNKKRNLRNKSIISNYRTELKKFIKFIEEKPTAEDLKVQLAAIHKMIDKTYSKGVINKNVASRKKSRITHIANQILI